jgi:outer membrane protein OmpA-like peptidoglycan-associated protein
VNDYGKPQNDMAQRDERAHELIEQLNLLEAVDRRITPEHVARRFHELAEGLGGAGPSAPADVNRQVRRESGIQRAGLRHRRLPKPLARQDRLREQAAIREAGKRYARVRLPRTKRLLGSRWITGVIAFAAAVVVIAVAVAVDADGLRLWTASPPGETNVIIAATATANEPAPALSTDIVQILQSAATTAAGVTAELVSPGGGQPTVLPLTPRRADGQVDYGPLRSQILAANLAAAQRLLEHQATRGQLDLLATIAAATKTTSAPATLIVVSSGLSTAGGLDLRQVGWDANPSSVAAQLKAEELLPDLVGWHVIFSGLGDTAGRQPPLPLPQQVTLIDYWEAICQASGAASCSVDETARPQLASYSATPVPVVAVPVVTSVRGPGMATVTALPDALLFQFDNTTLVPSADTILQPLVQRARSQHLQVSITGYASPDGGTNAYNLALSARRAIAVRNRLIALGLPAGQITQVTGAGTAGQNVSGCLVHGHVDEAICAQLRRVVVVLSPAKANP